MELWEQTKRVWFPNENSEASMWGEEKTNKKHLRHKNRVMRLPIGTVATDKYSLHCNFLFWVDLRSGTKLIKLDVTDGVFRQFEVV
jgi:hypothetical protein